MSPDLERVLEKERLRYRVLKAIYDLTDGSTYGRVMPLQIAESAGVDLDEAELALGYLDGEGLTKLESLSGTRSIAHPGVVEIESSIKHPESETPHFSASVVRDLNAEKAEG